MDVLHPSGLCSCSYRLSLRALEVYWRQRSDSLKTQGRAHTRTSTHTCAHTEGGVHTRVPSTRIHTNTYNTHMYAAHTDTHIHVYTQVLQAHQLSSFLLQVFTQWRLF